MIYIYDDNILINLSVISVKCNISNLLALALPTSFSDLDARNEENRLQSPGSQVLQTSNQSILIYLISEIHDPCLDISINVLKQREQRFGL